MKRIMSLILAAVISLPLLCTSVSAESGTMVFPVKPETAAVPNPHKGWVEYVYDPSWFDDPVYGIKNDPVWNMISVVYSRFNWKDIETSEGVYDWSRIDKMAELCDKYGKTFAFGIVPADSGSDAPDGLVPQYVYDKGCKYTTAAATSFYNDDSTQRTPVWSDKHYSTAAMSLAKAIAERYDGDSRIEFIDIRTYGNWGEWHTYGLDGSKMPSEDMQKKCLKDWSELFHSTQLVLPVNNDKPTPVSEYAVSLGITLRRDGLVGLIGHEKALLPAAENNLPTVGEMCYGYSYQRDDGSWTDKALIDSVEVGKLTYMALGGSMYDGSALYSDKKELVERLSNEMGYNFTVTSASLTRNESKTTIKVKIKNTGNAPAYFPMELKFAVTDQNGRVIKILPKSFKIDSGAFGSGKTKTISFTLDSSLFPKGKHLAVGAFEDSYEKGSTPNIRFANKHTADNNYLLLGKISK